jgi:hypothetical protein
MAEVTGDLERMTFHIPNLWDRNWAEAIESAEEPEKAILFIQRRAVLILKEIEHFQVTFARLAWLNIWSKTFSALDGTLCSLAKDSIYLLRILTRTTLELELHLHMIMQPVLDLCEQRQGSVPAQSKKEKKAASINRLEAYASWCIWNDRCHYKQIVEPGTSEVVWDPEPSLKIVNDPDALVVHEAIFGKLDVETNKMELKKGRLIQQDVGYHRIRRLETWLNHPVLASWHEKLKSLAGRKEKNFVTFFSLVGEASMGVPKGMENLEIPFAYPVYNEGSLAIHGSTLDQFLHLGETEITPLLLGQPDEISSVASQIGQMCNRIIVGLFLLQTRVWGNGNDPLPPGCT